MGLAPQALRLGARDEVNARRNPRPGEGIGAQNEEIFRDLLGLGDGNLKPMHDEGVI